MESGTIAIIDGTIQKCGHKRYKIMLGKVGFKLKCVYCNAELGGEYLRMQDVTSAYYRGDEKKDDSETIPQSVQSAQKGESAAGTEETGNKKKHISESSKPKRKSYDIRTDKPPGAAPGKSRGAGKKATADN